MISSKKLGNPAFPFFEEAKTEFPVHSWPSFLNSCASFLQKWDQKVLFLSFESQSTCKTLLNIFYFSKVYVLLPSEISVKISAEFRHKNIHKPLFWSSFYQKFLTATKHNFPKSSKTANKFCTLIEIFKRKMFSVERLREFVLVFSCSVKTKFVKIRDFCNFDEN